MTCKLLRSFSIPLLSLLPFVAEAQIEKLSQTEYTTYEAMLPKLIGEIQPKELQSYLSTLQKKQGLSLKDLANAVRTGNDLKNLPSDARFGYYAVPAMSELQRLPDAYPNDGRVTEQVRILAAQDEYEPGSFVVYPFSDLGKVSFKLGEFKSSEGTVFPASNLDLKVVKVWYQNGNGWYSYFGDTELKLTPELLVNDEDLILVDTKKVQNYARLTEKDGTVSYQWLTPPHEMNNRFEEHYRSTQPFAPMKPNFKDAKTLQPVKLDAGQFKQFFLTANVTDKIKAGLYSGHVILSKDQTQLGTIPVTIKVLPFKLPQPKTFFDLKKDFLIASYNYTNFEMIAEENGGDLELAERQMLSVMKDLKAHNQTSHWVRGAPYQYEYRRQIELMKEAGLRTDVLLANSSPFDSGNPKTMARTAKLDREYNEKFLGHNNVFIGYGDEPGAGWVMQTRPIFEAFQKEGFKFIIAGGDLVFFKAGYLYDFFNIAKNPEDPTATRKWNELGKAHVAWYATHHVGPENPAFNRRQYGMAPYLANYSALCNYAHHFGPYNDRSIVYKPMVFAYGSYDGVIDTIQWEGFREGVDDIRYATLLKTLAREATDSSDLNVQYAGRQALQYLAEMDSTTVNLNTARLEMIQFILKLRDLLKIK